MKRLLKKTIQTSRELKEFKDHLIHDALFDENFKGGTSDAFEIEADRLIDDIMTKLSFLKPAVKKRFGNDSVLMRVGIYQDQEYDLDAFARSLGFRNWKVAVIVYYALLMEESK